MKDIKKIKEFLESVGADVSKLDKNGHYNGSLYLEHNQLTEVTFPEGMTIGGSLYLGYNQLTEKVTPPPTKPAPTVFHWEWRGRRYIKADGIFQQVVLQKGNVYRVKNIGATKETYLITDGDGRWSHGDTLKQAKDDLMYKIADRDTSKYKSLTLDSTLSLADAIQCYRVITGACAAGTKSFVTSLPTTKEEYTIREIIDLTTGYYGAETFKGFFTR